MSFPSDGMAVHQLSRTKDLDKKLFELCRIGSIEIETGVMEPCPPKRLDWEAEEELPKFSSIFTYSLCTKSKKYNVIVWTASGYTSRSSTMSTVTVFSTVQNLKWYFFIFKYINKILFRKTYF